MAERQPRHPVHVAVNRLPDPPAQLRPKFSKLWRYIESINSEDEAQDAA